MADHPELSAEERAGKAFPVSWDQFHRDCRALTWRLNSAGPFHAIIAITRGGLVPAAIVARELGVRVIDTVCIASYEHNKRGELQVLKGLSADALKLGGGDGKGLLIIDDLVDTGKTALIVRDMLPKAHFATVYAKPMGRPLVDTYITEVSQDTWIFFRGISVCRSSLRCAKAQAELSLRGDAIAAAKSCHAVRQYRRGTGARNVHRQSWHHP